MNDPMGIGGYMAPNPQEEPADTDSARLEFIEWLEELGVARAAAEKAVDSYAEVVWAEGFRTGNGYVDGTEPDPSWNPYHHKEN